MQGSNTSRIGMARQRQSWDDSSWGGTKNNKSKSKSSSHQSQRSAQSQGAQTKKNQTY